MPEASDKPEWAEETEIEISEFVEPMGISQMPPTPGDWLPELNQWEPGSPNTPEQYPLEVTVTLPKEHWDEAVATLAQIKDEHLEVVWEDWGGKGPLHGRLVRRIRIKGWWTEDPDAIVPALKRAEAITLWHVQNRMFQANGFNPIPAEEFFPLRACVGWANAVAQIKQNGEESRQD